MALTAFIQFLIVLVSFSLVKAEVPSNTTIGTFGPLITYQPVSEWVYPENEDIPIFISLGNASLALFSLPKNVANYSSFGFQLTYGVSSTSSPGTYIQMDNTVVPQFTQMFNFTGNLLSNTFWWNTSINSLPAGSYVITSSASFFACSNGSPNCDISFGLLLLTN